MTSHENFKDMKLRNQRAKQLQAEGYAVKKSSFGPCELHPMYIEDLKHSPEGQDTGFGNTMYKTLFARLYRVEYERLEAI